VAGTIGDRVYEAIKARVIAYDFPEGQRIYLEPIAKRLGVSTKPVRNAVNRLVTEGLVIKAPRRGFIARTLSEAELIDQYTLTRLQLSEELGKRATTGRRKLPENDSIAGILNKLRRRKTTDVSKLATHTGEIFAQIAALSGNAKVVHSISRANDRLYYIRTLECQHLDNVRLELTRFCELVLAGRCDELMAAIQAYHNRRVKLLPMLLKFHRGRSAPR
jgi:DNA-binding GntR family transcriptional regulator